MVEAPFHKKIRLLIIEDDQNFSRICADRFLAEGYTVETAFDGRDGISKARVFRPDVVLLDIILPKLDGISVLKELKNDPEIASIPVIILTILETSETVMAALAAGSTHYLVKAQYTLDELSRKVREVLHVPDGRA